jgi:hypothetical protein
LSTLDCAKLQRTSIQTQIHDQMNPTSCF